MSKQTKRLNYQQAQDEVIQLQDLGHEVIMFSDTHWRIDNFIDVWPARRKFMKLDGNWKSRTYNRLMDIFI